MTRPFQHSNQVPPNVMARLSIMFHSEIRHDMEDKYSRKDFKPCL